MTTNNTSTLNEMISRKNELMDCLNYEPWNDGLIQEFVEAVDKLERDFGYKDEGDDAFLRHIYTF